MSKLLPVLLLSLVLLSSCSAKPETESIEPTELPVFEVTFSGDGKHNYFRNAYKGGETWDWSLPSPYET